MFPKKKRRSSLAAEAQALIPRIIELLRSKERMPEEKRRLLEHLRRFGGEAVEPTKRGLENFKRLLKKHGEVKMEAKVLARLSERSVRAFRHAVEQNGSSGLRGLLQLEKSPEKLYAGIGQDATREVTNRLAEWGLQLGMTREEVEKLLGP